LNELFTISIAGLRFRVRSEPGLSVDQPDALYRQFFNSQVETDLQMAITLTTEPEPDWSSQPVLFDTGETWSAFRINRRIGLRLPNRKAPGYLWATSLSESYEDATVHCSSLMINKGPGLKGVITNPVHYPLDQILAMFHFSAHRGLIVHAAGISRGDVGVFCAGRSGAGKTTLMQQWRGIESVFGLSDDRIVIREIDGSFRLFGTPWAGEGRIASHGDVRLKSLAFIHHGEHNEIRPISPEVALKQLLPTSSILWFDRPALERALSLCHDLVQTVPAFEIHCRPDPPATELINQLFD